MKPDWDKLMKNWNKGERAKTSLIADVDCTDEKAKPLCETHGVEGFPTIKWGDPSSLETYEGGREYKDLKKFAKENLKPMCSPVNIDLCDDAKKAEIAKFQAMTPEELTAAIDEKKAAMKAAGETFDAEVKKLQETYEKLQKDKEESIKAVKESGLGLMQAVANSLKAAKKEEL
ncbi:unnamed protein product [Prorocentrum cordatum]|uniref:Thioredoxin domain-containing protein n=1 Tax=Prorocentrum cordatum TaxID=2364126 RepID=A0ABN9UCN9_9DINO|nr:unnamed protein product [Polarella glacialis]|mmetsp:Transcript_44509/g.127476  ORF Transcript_44509/g.127476 Transcript_44509/m.127476 type:complete len:174 (-) Transcript_44509:97-618(-)